MSAVLQDEAFPTLNAVELGRLRRFGIPVQLAEADFLFEAGQLAQGVYVILSGTVQLLQRDGLGHTIPIATNGPGGFVGEVGQLSGGCALADAQATTAVSALLIVPARLRALVIAEAELGERIMRALVLRRRQLVAAPYAGPLLVGAANASAMVRLSGFLTRNSHPYHVLDPSVDPSAADLLSRDTYLPEDFPLVIGQDGTVLRNPDEHRLARHLMIRRPTEEGTSHDVAIVGAGPAGLATAVYAASEGLSVIILDSRGFGGQAGASARIENYLGFPSGISGQALASRAFAQAMKFGTQMLIPAEVERLDCTRVDGNLTLETGDGERVKARTVVIASGARYRRIAIANLAAFEGRGVWYWASPIEARMCDREEVVLIGGGNSAGQAAVFLSQHASKVWLVIRSTTLRETMSRYLIERIEAATNIELVPSTEVTHLEGSTDQTLAVVHWRNRMTGVERSLAIRNLFLFVGADPATAWLEGCDVLVDKAGFVLTGQPGYGKSALQTSVPGVFAVGDARSGSVKRVGGAIGEGAQVVPALHAFIASVAPAGTPARP